MTHDYIGVQLNDGTLRIERTTDILTIDKILKHDPARFTNRLRELAETLGISDQLFPKPIAEQIHRRHGWELWRYRGIHRRKANR